MVQNNDGVFVVLFFAQQLVPFIPKIRLQVISSRCSRVQALDGRLSPSTTAEACREVDHATPGV